MQMLPDVIRAVRDAVAAALAEGGTMPHGCRLVADRVVADIGFAVAGAPDETGGPRLVATQGGDRANSVRVEFVVERPGGGAAAVASPSAATVAVPVPELRGAEADRVAAELASVFGEPGFDSSARASVFREALESLDGDGIRALSAALDGQAPLEDRGLDRARHLVRRVVASGPGTVDAGVAVLRRVFGSYDPAAVVALVEDRWRTQDEWLE